MKPLYININDEQIQSNDELEVLKHDLDNDFFFYLGEKIAKKYKVENENALITDFNTQDNAEDYQKIIAQWNEIKAILFGEECEGEFKFTLPNGYIHWLRYSEKYNSIYDRNFSHGESTIITIDLEELYEDSVEDLQRKILRKLQRDDLYLEIDEVVFNDDAVTRKSPIIRTIKEKHEGIGFMAYKKWLEKGEVIENQLPEEKEQKIDSSFLYLIRKEHGVFKVLDRDGRMVKPLETIIVVDYRFNAYLQDKMPPYLLGLNTADDKLYFISTKQILCMGDWCYGKLYTDYGFFKNSQFEKYSHHSNLYEKEVILQDDFKTFCIKDKYDYMIYYRVENGVCKCQSEEDLNIEVHNIIQKSYIPYITDLSKDKPVTICTITGNEVIIPGFKINIYLGKESSLDIFWATKNYQVGQYRFKESFIVDIDGNIIRNYGYNHALPLKGEYILNINVRQDNNALNVSSISKLNGNIIKKIDTSVINVNGDCEETEPNIFKFNSNYHDSDSWFWLVENNVFCQQYNKDFYCVPDKNNIHHLCVYKRTDRHFVGNISKFNIHNFRNYSDDIYYGDFDNGRRFLNSKGEPIYTLGNNEFPLSKNNTESFEVCGISENRIVLNVDNRYYKILDYNGNEIARVDFNGISDCYHCGKLYYYNGTELGYYDYDGVKNLIKYETSESIKLIRILSSNLLLVIHDSKEVVIDLEGIVMTEAQSIIPEPLFNRYIDVRDKNNNRFIYDDTCKMLTRIDSMDEIFILK